MLKTQKMPNDGRKQYKMKSQMNGKKCKKNNMASTLKPSFVMKTASLQENDINKNSKYSPRKTVLMKAKCRVISKIATTLQGSCYNGMDINGDRVVIKRADKKLSQNNTAIINNEFVESTENIVYEAKSMFDIQEKKPPKGMVKIINFIDDEKNYFLIMEYGGISLFNYVNMCHKLILQKKLCLHEWKKHVNILFKQMVTYIHWLHKTAKYAHMDISLENVTIKGYVIKNGKYINHGQIYFIDFGLAKSFENEGTMNNCKRFVGKKAYESPEIAYEIKFNASKNDIYSLGVILFMLSFGFAPYSTPCSSDDSHFCNIMNGYLTKMIKDLGRINYVSKNLLSLLNNILCFENKRINIDQLIKHEYIIN